MEQISSLLAAAAVGGFAITAVAGKFMIPALHRLHFGQTIREEGPTWHSKKNGTPTMGGLCFILGILATLGIVWVMYSPKLPEVLGMPQLQAVCWCCFSRSARASSAFWMTSLRSSGIATSA